ncbi:unnamed protein product [Orchesella dallaii]|uniref:Uncharacterized protein n=1 Tax=Orchesella dallaii TaxID=48710 RepID=A0ABP1S3M0_9HEXA
MSSASELEQAGTKSWANDCPVIAPSVNGQPGSQKFSSDEEAEDGTSANCFFSLNVDVVLVDTVVTATIIVGDKSQRLRVSSILVNWSSSVDLRTTATPTTMITESCHCCCFRSQRL